MIQIKVFKLIPHFLKEIKIFTMKSQFLQLIPDSLNDIEILNVLSVWHFSASALNRWRNKNKVLSNTLHKYI